MNKKVKILNKDGIWIGYDLTDGKIYEVIKESEVSGSIWVVDDAGSELCINKGEFKHIEFITETEDATTGLTREEAVMAMLQGKKVGRDESGHAFFDKSLGFSFYNSTTKKISNLVAFLNIDCGYSIVEPEVEFRGKTYNEEKFLKAIKDLDEL